MKVCSWLKSHTFQTALHILSVDHLNIHGPPLPLKSVRKFGSVAYRGMYVCKVRVATMTHDHNDTPMLFLTLSLVPAGK